jgi:NTE family protein
MSSLFFDYPTEPEDAQAQDLVLLPHWDNEKWQKLLRYTQIRRFVAGEYVIQIGDTSRTFYILLEGQLEVLLPQSGSTMLRVTQMRTAGSVIGEQAFLDGQPRSATLRALTSGEALSVSLDAFQVFAAHEPELARDVLFDLARTLSVKLRQANAFISKWVK